MTSKQTTTTKTTTKTTTTTDTTPTTTKQTNKRRPCDGYSWANIEEQVQLIQRHLWA